MIDLPAMLTVAGRQHGVLSAADLRQLALTPGQVHRLRSTGVLVPVGHRTVRVAGLPQTGDQAVMAACLESGGVASHATAARLHGIGSWALETRPSVIVRRGTKVFRSPIATMHSSTWLPADDLVVIRHIPCTSVARTLLSLADPQSGISPARLRDLVDEAVRDGKASDPWLWWRLEQLRRRGRGGTRALGTVLADRAEGGRTESWLERETLRLIDGAHLPRPTTQRRIRRNGAFVGRVDFIYDEQRLVVEVTGHAFHSTREQRLVDANRRNQLILAGYRVLEFTYDDVVRFPATVVATLAEALASTLR